MEFVTKAIAQAPLVAVITYIWWSHRKDAQREMDRLRERIKEKDDQFGKMIETFNRLSLSLELIKERLR